MGVLNLRILTIKLAPTVLIRASRLSTKTGKNVELHTVNMSFESYKTTPSLAFDSPPPLVVMHGLFGSKRNWNSLCKAFHQKTTPQRSVIAVDARNHGDSPHSDTHSYPHLAEDIRNLLDDLKIKKVALLGHSMGGRAMMYFALQYPEVVDKLIVGDISPTRSSGNLTSMSPIFRAVQSVILPSNVSMASARLTCDAQLKEHIDDKGLRSFLLTNLVQKPDGSYGWRINVPTLLTHFPEHIAQFPDVSDLKFDGSVLFVAGGTSDYIQKSDHADILKIFPQAQFEEISGAGHWVHSEKPNEFLQICTEFLNK